MPSRIVPNLWFDTQAEDAAKLYVSVFPDSKITNVSRYGEAGKEVHRKPVGSAMVVAFEFECERITFHVDPDRPNAWVEQPYYADLKRWAALAAQDLRQVIVRVGDRSIVILPTEDVDLGVVTDDERIVLGEVPENGRLRLRAFKLRADDPRLAGAHEGEIYDSGSNPSG